MPIAKNVWTIHNDPSPNPGRGDELNGLTIEQLSHGGYQLKSASTVLKTTTDSNFPISFNNVNYRDEVWDITGTNLPVGADGSGTWKIKRISTTPETGDNGEYTAQAGSGAEEPDDTASSAYA